MSLISTRNGAGRLLFEYVITAILLGILAQLLCIQLLDAVQHGSRLPEKWPRSVRVEDYDDEDNEKSDSQQEFQQGDEAFKDMDSKSVTGSKEVPQEENQEEEKEEIHWQTPQDFLSELKKGFQVVGLIDKPDTAPSSVSDTSKHHACHVLLESA